MSNVETGNAAYRRYCEKNNICELKEVVSMGN